MKHRLAAMQPVSWSRWLVRLGTAWLVVAALALAGCIDWGHPRFIAIGAALGEWSRFR